MCPSHQEASPTAAAGSPSSPVSGRGPRGGTGDGIPNRALSASSEAVTACTVPLSSASRTQAPDTPTTTVGTPLARSRPPTPTPRRPAGAPGTGPRPGSGTGCRGGKPTTAALPPGGGEK